MVAAEKLNCVLSSVLASLNICSWFRPVSKLTLDGGMHAGSPVEEDKPAV